MFDLTVPEKEKHPAEQLKYIFLDPAYQHYVYQFRPAKQILVDIVKSCKNIY